MSFYGSGLGNRLINKSLYSSEIKEFLNEEKKLLDQIKLPFDSIVEVGCMHGRYLQWAIEHNRKYIGIDIVPLYISEGRKIVAELSMCSGIATFILGKAENVDTLLGREADADLNRSILLFPFNSFGNMDACLPVIKSIKRSGLPFLISTYATTKKATLCRQKYYEACLYNGLKMLENKEGVLFVSDDGLRTIAYHPAFLLNIFRKEDINIELVNFAEIGMAYASREILTGK